MTAKRGDKPRARQFNPQSFGSDTINLEEHARSEQMSEQGKQLLESWQAQTGVVAGPTSR